MFDQYINHSQVFLCGIKIGNATRDFFDKSFFCNSSFREYVGCTQHHIQEKKAHIIQELIHPADFQELTAELQNIFHKRELIYRHVSRFKAYKSDTYKYMHITAMIQHSPLTNELEFILLITPADKECKRSQILSVLTEREQSIYILVEQKFPSRDIALMLNISLETVKTHRKNINKKVRALFDECVMMKV